ncbi:MAG: Gfo/Idh/MocA family oxidoreductase [Spirochaetota bacterium]
MTKKVIRLGVLGAADIAISRVIPLLEKSEKITVAALASRSEGKAKTWADKLGIQRYYGSYALLLKDPEIDAVYIPLPNGLHFQWTLNALDAGKHVMCEKPLTLTVREAERMITAAQAKKLVLMEGFMYRFHPRNRAVLEMVRQGEIGTVKAIESAFSYGLNNDTSYLMRPELGGGALYDVGCYCVHVSRMLTGEEPVEVYATRNLSKTGVDMTFAGTLRFPGNIISNFHVSMEEEPRFYYTVIGDKGLIEVPWAYVSYGKETAITIQKNEKREERTFLPADEYRMEFDHFADTILYGKEPEFVIDDSLRNIAVLEALIKSAREGRPVTPG